MGIFKSLLNFVFPEENICLFCKDFRVEEKFHICSSCQGFIEFVHREISSPIPYVEKAYYSVLYTRLIRENIHAFKFEGKSYLYKAFGDILLETIYEKGLHEKVDLIAFVPMDRMKKAQRGYNQCELMARYLSKKMDKPLLKDNIIKVKVTKEQNRLGLTERRTNLKDSFKAVKVEDFKAKEILLIDDIITTGTTMKEISKVLINNGARKVYGLAITSSMKI